MFENIRRPYTDIKDETTPKIRFYRFSNLDYFRVYNDLLRTYFFTLPLYN